MLLLKRGEGTRERRAEAVQEPTQRRPELLGASTLPQQTVLQFTEFRAVLPLRPGAHPDDVDALLVQSERKGEVVVERGGGVQALFIGLRNPLGVSSSSAKKSVRDPTHPLERQLFQRGFVGERLEDAQLEPQEVELVAEPSQSSRVLPLAVYLGARRQCSFDRTRGANAPTSPR